MIGVKIKGRLGNQLFQYAFIYAAHKELNTPFFLIKDGNPLEIYRYFKLKSTFFYKIDRFLFNYGGFKLFFSHYLRNLFYKGIIKLSVSNETTIENTLNPANFRELKDGTVYTGYFQSEDYFKNYAEEIKDLFQIKDKFIKKFEKKFKHLFDTNHTVVIHIRKTDYTDLMHLNLGSSDLSLPFTYFQQLIQKIHTSQNIYIFISDEIHNIKKEFANLENAYFSEENEITDFQFMLNANTCVISNSTFSWWAAYLNRRPDKKVFCPKYFLGYVIKQEYPANIYPPNWTQVET